MKKLVLTSLFALGLTGAALAQTPITFAQVDVDADGRLSLSELQAVWPDITAEEFAAVDVEGAGSITPAQLDSLQAASLGGSVTGGTSVEAGSTGGIGLDAGAGLDLSTGTADGAAPSSSGQSLIDLSEGD